MATKGEPTHWASATATSGPMSFSVCGVFRERVVALERMLDHEAVCDGCGVVSGMGVVGGGVGDFHLRLVKAFEAESDYRTALKDVLPYAERRAADLKWGGLALEEFAKTATPRSSACEAVKVARAEAEKATAAVDRAKKLLGVADGG